MADVQVNRLLDLALLCLTQAITGNPNPPENICRRLDLLVAHDADLYTDLCCEGLAYVSFGDINPAWGPEFPDPSLALQANRGACPVPAWAVGIRMGVVRCIPTGTSTTMPSCGDWTDASEQQANDAQALRAAACCFSNAARGLDETNQAMFFGMSVVIGTQQQVQIQGGCVERNVTITAQIPNCDCFSLS